MGTLKQFPDRFIRPVRDTMPRWFKRKMGKESKSFKLGKFIGELIAVLIYIIGVYALMKILWEGWR